MVELSEPVVDDPSEHLGLIDERSCCYVEVVMRFVGWNLGFAGGFDKGGLYLDISGCFDLEGGWFDSLDLGSD